MDRPVPLQGGVSFIQFSTLATPRRTFMKNILITGSNGFIARNLKAALGRLDEEHAVNLLSFSRHDSPQTLKDYLQQADLVFHLAGANRPQDESEFETVNIGLTDQICKTLASLENAPPVIFSSSTQATQENPYGRSKLAAEDRLRDYHRQTGNPISIYRLPNVFGKWCRPEYNSVVATFCYNIARGQDIQINDASYPLTLVYVDEVVRCLMRHLDSSRSISIQENVESTFETTVGELAERIQLVSQIRSSLNVPDFADSLTRCLYSTFLSCLPEDNFASPAQLRKDDRGWLFELIKSESFGQIFVSKTRPGITRGNHYHDTKVEKFCLVHGSGTIRFRLLESDQIIEYPVDDQEIKIVDIPPGYTHSIENTGAENMIVLFWANEVFDPQQPDTYWVPVIQ